MVPNTLSSKSYAGNNSTVTGYPVPFKFAKNDHLTVTVVDADGVATSLALTSGFTVTGAGNDAGGTLKTVVAVPGTSTVLIERNTPMLNLTDWNDVETWRAATLEGNFDWLAMAAIDSDRRASVNLTRALRVGVGETLSELPEATDRAGKVQSYDDEGQPDLKTPAQLWADADTEVSADVAAAIAAANAAAASEADAEAAAADAAAASLTANDLFLNRQSLQHFYQGLIDASDNTSFQVSKRLAFCPGGDSMASNSGPNGYINEEMIRRFGQGAIKSATFNAVGRFSESFGNPAAGGYEPTYSGVGTDRHGRVGGPAVNFQYLPTGQYFTIVSGGSVTETIVDKRQANFIERVRCWYAIKAGNGTLTFTLTQNGVALTPKVVNTATGTSGSIAYVDFTAADGLKASGDISLVTSSATATSHYIGTYILKERGAFAASLQCGGVSIATAFICPDANITTYLSAMGVKLVSWAFKEEDTTGAGINALMAKCASTYTGVSHLFLGQTPMPVNNSQNIIINAFMRANCITYGFCYADLYRVLKDSATVDLLGWEEDPAQPGGGVTDGPHLNTRAHRFLGAWVIQNLFLGFYLPGSNRVPVFRHELENDFFTRRFQRSAWFGAFTGSDINGTTPNWTFENRAGAVGFRLPAGTAAPTANSECGVPVMMSCDFNPIFDFKARWMTAANLPAGCTYGMAFGSSYANATDDPDGAAFVGSVMKPTDGTDPLLWVQVDDTAGTVRILLSDGTTVHQSPDIPLPMTPTYGYGYGKNTGFNPGHVWGVHYISGNNSTSKRVIVYCSAMRPVNGSIRPGRPYVVAVWDVTVNNTANFINATYAENRNLACFRITAGPTPGANLYQPLAYLLAFEVDTGSDEGSDTGNPPHFALASNMPNL